MTDPIIIAIDGHSSCGKSTMAKDLARAIGYIYVDTGAMYRAVTLYSIRRGLWKDGVLDTETLRNEMSDVRITFRLNAETGLPETYLNGENVEQDIRSMEVSAKVSPIATLDFVREAMVREQQAMGKSKGIVMDGRDIGTTVFPEAEMKIFVTALPHVRAQRRLDELRAKGDATTTFDDVLANIEERDRIDSTRAVSPLRQAEDALVLDNSHMTIPQQKAWLLERFQEVTGS
ncbi:(d)CMP kinase [Porphyromonas gingivalis]|uniref:Cytidylate kinase n=2 Tax=Porphyromonas gingivalis TaxID=837 RepID=KCY_PORGI|nr:(d)CMP kinase [Porphyromonas gingivalis]Q7MWK7.1 RecName: Full=Cytidylate kinase; Short=CK; AltName: Full=Cytidine monophosphate kinase; Short=CMP kinase [Porphyromonas gingivalis W83]AAQ65787.1 cytidylate kinase [Porphyromonas gingivalis W83]AKV64543.1 cytidylate kinase [Porphyromonas gingivalis]ATR93920.1 cytidylate kinase [Porphyromonas gingivalis]ATR97082.1 cytidylate kinase [Porphyromonas gingivalis]ATR98144.1 cytidylate kinase [Porphyromonas gingivalis]